MTSSEAKLKLVDAYLDRYFSSQEIHSRTQVLAKIPGEFHAGCNELLNSMRYSLLQTGKRFRPLLSLMTAEALGTKAELVLPFAAAVECIHTYSLIHDDLPCMDNDDMRRGQPTNHKVFPEATALLAGDALLTEAFRIVAHAYSQNADGAGDATTSPAHALQATLLLAEAAGVAGMVGGQAIDMHSKVEEITLQDLERMHRLKTGALIRVACVGSATLAGASVKQLHESAQFAEGLGLAFQVADDILDYDPQKIELGSFPSLLGLDKTKTYLRELSNQCLHSIASWPASAQPMRDLVEFNFKRQH